MGACTSFLGAVVAMVYARTSKKCDKNYLSPPLMDL